MFWTIVFVSSLLEVFQLGYHLPRLLVHGNCSFCNPTLTKTEAYPEPKKHLLTHILDKTSLKTVYFFSFSQVPQSILRTLIFQVIRVYWFNLLINFFFIFLHLYNLSGKLCLVCVLFSLKRLWHKFTHDKKKRRKKKSRTNSSSAYNTLPYFYPTEQVNNINRLKKKKKYW